MTFDEWWQKNGTTAVCATWTEDACKLAWNAAMESAAQTCEKEAEDSKRHRLHEYAAGANICASNIRDLMKKSG